MHNCMRYLFETKGIVTEAEEMRDLEFFKLRVRLKHKNLTSFDGISSFNEGCFFGSRS